MASSLELRQQLEPLQSFGQNLTGFGGNLSDLAAYACRNEMPKAGFDYNRVRQFIPDFHDPMTVALVGVAGAILAGPVSGIAGGRKQHPLVDAAPNAHVMTVGADVVRGAIQSDKLPGHAKLMASATSDAGTRDFLLTMKPPSVLRQATRALSGAASEVVRQLTPHIAKPGSLHAGNVAYADDRLPTGIGSTGDLPDVDVSAFTSPVSFVDSVAAPVASTAPSPTPFTGLDSLDSIVKQIAQPLDMMGQTTSTPVSEQQTSSQQSPGSFKPAFSSPHHTSNLMLPVSDLDPSQIHINTTTTKQTHANYPAYDFILKKGTKLILPVDSCILTTRDSPTNRPVGSTVFARVNSGPNKGTEYYYAHMGLHTLKVKAGECYDAGHPLGSVGNTHDAGESVPHLHMDHLPAGHDFRMVCASAACSKFPWIPDVQPDLQQADLVYKENWALAHGSSAEAANQTSTANNAAADQPQPAENDTSETTSDQPTGLGGWLSKAAAVIMPHDPNATLDLGTTPAEPTTSDGSTSSQKSDGSSTAGNHSIMADDINVHGSNSNTSKNQQKKSLDNVGVPATPLNVLPDIKNLVSDITKPLTFNHAEEPTNGSASSNQQNSDANDASSNGNTSNNDSTGATLPRPTSIPTSDPGNNNNHAREMYAMQYLIDNLHITPAQAAGYTGNFMVETCQDLDPTTLQGTCGGGAPTGEGVGLAQWTKSARWREEVKYAEDHKVEPKAMDTQLGFTVHESTNVAPWNQTLKHIRTTKTPEAAAITVEKYYEKAGHPAKDKRAELARTAYDHYVELAKAP